MLTKLLKLFAPRPPYFNPQRRCTQMSNT